MQHMPPAYLVMIDVYCTIGQLSGFRDGETMTNSKKRSAARRDLAMQRTNSSLKISKRRFPLQEASSCSGSRGRVVATQERSTRAAFIIDLIMCSGSGTSAREDCSRTRQGQTSRDALEGRNQANL